MTDYSIIEDEERMDKWLNGKKYCDLHSNLKYFLRNMFGDIFDDTIIYCKRIGTTEYRHYEVKVGALTKYVSQRLLCENIVRQITIYELLGFLKKKGISEETLNVIKMYHFGDGTLTGSKERIINRTSTNSFLYKKFKKVNWELNHNYDLILEFFNASVFHSTKPELYKVRYVYIGYKEWGEVIDITQVARYIRHLCWVYVHGIHIGPLYIVPHIYTAKKPVINENARSLVDIKWKDESAKVRYIAKKFNYLSENQKIGRDAENNQPIGYKKIIVRGFDKTWIHGKIMR